MKKIKNLSIGIQTLVILFGLAVPVQAAINVGTSYYQSGGSVISLRSITPAVTTTTPTTPATAPTNTSTNTSTQPGTTPSISTTPVVSSPYGAGSVISLKNYFYKIPTTTQPSTTPTTTPAPAPTPAPVPSPTPAPTTQPSTQPTTSPASVPAATSVSAQEQQMIDEINKERAAAGLSALKIDLRLVGVAQTKASDMKANGYFSHTSPTYGTPFDMIKKAGVQYRYAGENIARNISVDAAMAAFMSSDGHRKNILNPAYTHVGVGVVTSSAGNYYVQVFAQE